MDLRGVSGPIPFGLVLLKSLSLAVIAEGKGVDKPPKLELLWPEHRHGGR